jgi:signal peptidase I
LSPPAAEAGFVRPFPFHGSTYVTRPRKAWIAALLSFCLAGLGQLYAGRPGRALAWLLGSASSLWLLGGLVLLAPARPVLIAMLLLAVAIPLAGIIDAALVAKRSDPSYVLRPYNRWWLYLAAFVLIGWGGLGNLSDLRKRYFVETFRIPASSMQPTLLIGDYVFVDKRGPGRIGFTRGSLVVFESIEEAGLKVLKRVAAISGDTIAMHDGHVVLNGQPLEEPYARYDDPSRSEDAVQRAKMRKWQIAHLIGAAPAAYAPDLNEWGPVAVPPDSVLVLGDNRDASYDGRYYGFIPRTAVVGRPLVIYYSVDASSPSLLPFLTAVRWERIGLHPDTVASRY